MTIALASLLLADPSPCLRRLVLREILGRPEDDPEVRELEHLRESDPLVTNLVQSQAADGSWSGSDLGWPACGRVRATSVALARLGYLGFGPDFPPLARGAEVLFSQQQADGSWLLAEAVSGGVLNGQPVGEDKGYSMVPLQTAIPLRGLTACGFAADFRAERAYEWLLAQRLPDGAWPTGVASGNYGYVAGYRRLAHSRWGCRSNTTGALLCLAYHPERRRSAEARRALDLLLGRETREEHTLGFEVARLVGLEPPRGFLTHYARFDLALVLDLCGRVGAGLDDERVGELTEFVQGLQGPYGLWEYPGHPQAARWVTFDLLRSLARLDEAGEWLSTEPRTPFRAYARKARRF